MAKRFEFDDTTEVEDIIYEDENIFKASSMLMEEIQKRQGAP